MIEAGLWGFVAASSLIIGAVLAFAFDSVRAKRGFILAFGAGTLLGAVAYELIEDSLADSERGIEVAIGFALGALIFYIGSVLIDRMRGRRRIARTPMPRWRRASTGPRGLAARAARTKGLAVVLGAVLDGIPESVVLGLSLIGGAGIGVPGAGRRLRLERARGPVRVGGPLGFGRPEAPDHRDLGRSSRSSAGSRRPSASGCSTRRRTFWVGLIQSFAAGAILAMLAESMIPEAYEIGGRPVGLATCIGFALAAYLSLRT